MSVIQLNPRSTEAANLPGSECLAAVFPSLGLLALSGSVPTEHWHGYTMSGSDSSSALLLDRSGVFRVYPTLIVTQGLFFGMGILLMDNPIMLILNTW